MTLIDQVKKTIDRYNLINSGERIVVGVSGGPDSLALLHILNRLQAQYEVKLHVAHLNHKLRGAAAQKDAQFVAKQAQKLEVEFTCAEKNVAEYSDKNGLSLEDAARQVRYDFLSKLRERLGFDKIAVGHHADDQAETVLMKFIRGASLNGIGGMAPKTDQVIRPLLKTTKKDLKTYCEQQKLAARFDETNAKADQMRNKIRLELMPLLETEYNQNLVATLNRNADIWRQENELLRNYAQQNLKKVIMAESKKSLTISRQAFDSYPIALQRRMIREVINKLVGSYQGFYHCHIQEIRELLATGETGSRLDLPQKVKLSLSYDQAIFRLGKAEKTSNFLIEAGLGENEIPALDMLVEARIVSASYPWRSELDNSNLGFFDLDQVGTEFIIRQRCPGDRFQPLGLEGSKKIKDFLIDEKVPRRQRDRVPIFTTKSGDVFWVGGLRIDDRFKITKETNEILMIKIISN